MTISYPCRLNVIPFELPRQHSWLGSNRSSHLDSKAMKRYWWDTVHQRCAHIKCLTVVLFSVIKLFWKAKGVVESLNVLVNTVLPQRKQCIVQVSAIIGRSLLQQWVNTLYNTDNNTSWKFSQILYLLTKGRTQFSKQKHVTITR